MHLKIRRRLSFLCVLLFIGCIAVGSLNYFHQGQEISHFKYTGIQLDPTNNQIINVTVWVIGQYKTTGKGFYVGKKIEISALAYLRDKDIYEKFKNLPAGIVAVRNSETPETHNEDMSDIISSHNLTHALMINEGYLHMTNFDDSNNLFELRGDVVCTKEGVLTFGSPMIELFKANGVLTDDKTISIGSSSEGDQIESNRLILLFAWITAALTLLTLRFVIMEAR